MKAPTNIYGPDRSLCRAGEEIPAAWFDAMPDLKAHLKGMPDAPDEPRPAASEPFDVATEGGKTAPAAKKVRAAAKVGRERGSKK